MNKITEIETRIRKNQEAMLLIHEEYLKANCPQGYKTGTSYLDADTIHGSRKEFSVSSMVESLRLLEHLIYIDTVILENYKKENRVAEKLKELETMKDKVYYLRQVEGYTQEKTAEIINISCRHLQRLESEINKELRQQE